MQRSFTLSATLFTYLAFNVADQVLMSQGLKAAFGWNADVVAVVVAILAAVIAIWGHDWVHRVFRSILVFSLPVTTILTIGVILGLAHGHQPKQHFGFLLAAGLAATMGMNAYGGMLSVLTGIDSVKPIKPGRRARVVTIIALTVVWYAIGTSISTSAVSTVLNSLTLMLYLLVPWTATNLVDFFLVRRGHYAITDLFSPNGIYRAWNWRGLTAYAAGFAAEIPFMVLPGIGGFHYTGIAARQMSGVDISWLVGLAVTGAVYWLVSRSIDVTAEGGAIEASEQRLTSLARAGG